MANRTYPREIKGKINNKEQEEKLSSINTELSKEKGRSVNQNEVLGILMEKYEELKQLKNKGLDSLLTKESIELLEKAENVSTFNKADIVNAGIQHRANYIITASKSIKDGKATSQLAGTAYLSVDSFVKALMNHNEAQEFKKDRIAITQTVVMNSAKESYRESNFYSVGFGKEGISVNRAALKRYMSDNEDAIIKHNVKMHVFDDIIKYVREPQRTAMKAKAKEFGWIEKS